MITHEKVFFTYPRIESIAWDRGIPTVVQASDLKDSWTNAVDQVMEFAKKDKRTNYFLVVEPLENPTATNGFKTVLKMITDQMRFVETSDPHVALYRN